MPYCTKCGAEVSEEMEFCPKCGTRLKPPPAPVRMEKEEKEEKEEKREKTEKKEKYEKREFGYVGPLVGGVILIIVGIMLYLAAVGPMYMHDWGPIFMIMVGIIILAFGLYAALIAAKRSPRPP